MMFESTGATWNRDALLSPDDLTFDLPLGESHDSSKPVVSQIRSESPTDRSPEKSPKGSRMVSSDEDFLRQIRDGTKEIGFNKEKLLNGMWSASPDMTQQEIDDGIETLTSMFIKRRGLASCHEKELRDAASEEEKSSEDGAEKPEKKNSSAQEKQSKKVHWSPRKKESEKDKKKEAKEKWENKRKKLEEKKVEEKMLAVPQRETTEKVNSFAGRASVYRSKKPAPEPIQEEETKDHLVPVSEPVEKPESKKRSAELEIDSLESQPQTKRKRVVWGVPAALQDEEARVCLIVRGNPYMECKMQLSDAIAMFEMWNEKAQ